MKKVAFRVEADNVVGSGHLFRMLILSNILKHIKIFWIVSGVKKKIKKFLKNKKFLIIKDILDNQKILKILKKKKISILVSDIASERNVKKKNFLNSNKYFKSNKIFLCNFDLPNYHIDGNISIIPYFLNQKKISVEKNCLKMFGPKYFFFNNFIKKKFFKKKVKKIFIFISAADKNHISIKILKKLILLGNYKITLVCGYDEKIYKKAQDMINDYRLKKNIEIIKGYKNLNNKIDKYDAAIVGEGHIKYDTCFALVPSFVVTINDHNSVLLNSFKKKNACKFFKYNNNEERLDLEIKKFILSYKIRFTYFRNCKKIFNINNLGNFKLKQEILENYEKCKKN